MRRLMYRWRRKVAGTHKIYIIPSRFIRYKEDELLVSWFVHDLRFLRNPLGYRWR